MRFERTGSARMIPTVRGGCEMGHTVAACPEEIRHSFADVNGIQIHYASAGAGLEGRARIPRAQSASRLIIFLHGFPEFWYAWRTQLVEFGRDYFAVAPDMRGYNLSSKPAEIERYEMGQLVGDMRALVAHLGAKSSVLVGHDWGGVVAWAVAIACPEVVEKLVIINAPHPGIFERELAENPAQQQASQYMHILRSPEAEAQISANNFALFQEGILGDGLRQGYFSEADRRAYVEAWSQPGALSGGLNYYRAQKIGPPTGAGEEASLMKWNLPSLGVEAPTLVIWGEKDPYLLTGNLNGLDRYVRHLRVERIPDGTHWVVHEKPTLVNSLIRSFLDS
jgi:pimeloyl-ACP methyl ester carboxylesterase